MDRIYVAKKKEIWPTVVNEVKNFRVSVKCREFLDLLRVCWVLRKDSVTWSLGENQGQRKLTAVWISKTN